MGKESRQGGAIAPATPPHDLSRPATLGERLSAIAQSELLSGDPVRQVEAILSRDDAPAYIESLDGASLFRLIKTAGWDQGIDLVPYATPSQLQTFLDFDGWRRERFLPQRAHQWLGAIVQEASDTRLREVCRELDAELLAMYFKSGFEQVELAEEGRVPEHMPEDAVLSPDGVYALVYPDDEVYAATLKRLLARLYEVDRVMAWTLLEAVRWEMSTELEESALRWRDSRMQEQGFVPRDEALAIYRPLDPLRARAAWEDGSAAAQHRARAPERFDLPAVLTSELKPEFLLLEVLDALDDEAMIRQRLFELAALQNRAMIADGIEPGELESGRQVVRRTLGYASAGLAFMSRGNQARMLDALREVPLRELFRVGYSLVATLQRQAQQMQRRPTLSLVEGEPYALLHEDDAALMEGLLRQRPTWAGDAHTFDLFRDTQQVDDAALRLGLIGLKQLWLFGLMRQSPEQLTDLIYGDDHLIEPIDLTFELAMSTTLARHLIGQEATFEGLTPAQLGALLDVLRDADLDALGDEVALGPVLASARAALPPTSMHLMVRWVRDCLARLMDELGRVRDVQDARVVRSLLLLRKP